MLEQIQMIHGLQVHFIGFSKSDSRIKDDLFVWNTGASCNIDTFLGLGQHIYQEIIVLCFFFVVHQAAGCVVFCNDRCHLRIIFQSPDIVDQISTSLKRNFRNGCFEGVYGNRNIKVAVECFNNRKYTGSFFFCTDWCVAWSGGLAAYIQDVSTFRNHGLGMSQSIVHTVPFSTVRERIRSDIEDSHNISSIGNVKFAVSYFHGCNSLLFNM